MPGREGQVEGDAGERRENIRRRESAAAWQLNLPSSGREKRSGRKSLSLAERFCSRGARGNMTLKFLSNSGDDGGELF